MAQDRKPRVDEVARQIIDGLLTDKNKQIELQVAAQPIYILGHHKSQHREMESIRDELKRRKIPAMLAEEHENKEFLPDFEKEKLVLEKAGVLVILDGKVGAVVGESTYLMHCSEHQNKCVLMVHENNKNKIMSLREHYLYYPIKIVYSTPEELIDRAVEFAIQTSYRLAIIEVKKRTGNI